jgi:hypothetical protein
VSRSGVRAHAIAYGLAASVAVPALRPAMATEMSEVDRFAAWPTDNALTMPRGRVSIGLFSQSSWALTPRLELRAHPALFWILPHAEAKLRWLDAGRWQLSSSHRLTYPTMFLSLVAREGSGGLLPATTDVPYSLMIDNDVLGSVEWRDAQWATLRLGASVAARGNGDETLLDFPFLYQRFAALNAPLVPRVAVALNGDLPGGLGYAVEFRHYWLPLADFSLFHANEYAAKAYLQLGSSHRISVAGRLSSAQLPVGWRSHFLPHLDYELRF